MRKSSNDIADILAVLIAGSMAMVAFLLNDIRLQWLPILLLFAIGAFFMKQKKWLTLTGSLSAFFVACILFNGGIQLFIMPFFLLAGGTLVSKLNVNESEKNGRNAIQVMANGGVALVCILGWYWFEDEFLKRVFLKAYCISFAISICDTFSSEMGKYFNGRTMDIFTFKKIDKGLSGGVSMQGTMTGAMAVVLACSITALLFDFKWETTLYIAIAGFLGMLLDSLVGSIFQAKYQALDGQIIESKSDSTKPYKGFAWCTNDVVNILSNIIVTGAFIAGVFILR